MDALTETLSATELISSTEQDDGQDIEGTLISVRELLYSVKKEVKMDCLETAISSLQDALNDETIVGETHTMVYLQLIRAFLTRYGLFGWVDDIDTCAQHLAHAGVENLWKIMSQENDEDFAEVQAAVQLLKTCRDSINVDTLSTAIATAKGTLSSCPSNCLTTPIANLWILLGNALVIDYLCHREVGKLDQAAQAFQQAELICREDTSMTYLCSILLSHVELLRLAECNEPARIRGFAQYFMKAETSDNEGRMLYRSGHGMTHDADVNDVQFQMGMGLLNASLNSRTKPHPRRFFTLTAFACALHNRFKKYGDLQVLDKCVAAYQEALDVFPSPHPDRSLILDDLASALFTRFGSRGALPDLEEYMKLYREALTIQPPSNPGRSVSLDNLANALVNRYERTGTLADLDESILLHREALNLRPPPHTNRSGSLNNLAIALFTRFENKGAIRDLEEAIALQRDALELRPASHPDRPMSLNNLASSLGSRFSHTGELQNLEESITLHREALDLRSPPHPDRSMSLDNLATALSIRFEHKGAFSDLRECITLHREAVALLSPLHPARSMSLNNLANALITRFEHDGTLDDLEESIALHREALALRAPPHPHRSMSLNNLSNALSTRFQHKGAFEDLEESIVHHREALDLQELTHPRRSMTLNNLASALSTQFEHKGLFQDLEECINLHRDALHLSPSPHPDRWMFLNSLATALFTRFVHLGGFLDLEESIDLHREAIDLQLTEHSDRFKSLNNLALALCTRFEQKGAFPDLEECIALYREALNLLRPPHPNRSWSLNNLADALRTRFGHKGISRDLEECIILHQEALNLRPSPHPDRSTSLHNLAGALSNRFKFKRKLQDIEESVSLHREALEIRAPPHPDRHTSLSGLANSLYTRFEYEGAFQDLEECIALHREAIVAINPTHPYRSNSLHNLALALNTRFYKQGVLQDLEDSITLYREALELSPLSHPDSCMVLNCLACALFTRSKNGGKLEDLQTALESFERAAKYPTGSLVKRLSISANWASCAQQHLSASGLDAYKYSMELLPQLASLDLTLQQRQDVLQHTRDLVGNAAKCAIDASQWELAVTFLSTGRSIFWSQALQLRTPIDELRVTHSAIAERFITLSRQLENASYSEHHTSSSLEDGQLLAGTGMYKSLHALSDERQRTIEEIRGIPGYESFLLPPSFSFLQSAANNGPVIILNASNLGCDALIVHGAKRVDRIPLTGINMTALVAVKSLVQNSLGAGMRAIEIPQETQEILRNILGRDMISQTSTVNNSDSRDDTLRLALGCLWIVVVLPVLKALGLGKDELPGRIWWCPTGPFTSLPIHASGLYSDDNTPIDCLFQYAVSSYCTYLQDLLHPPPQMTQSFRVTAIIEPEAPRAQALPATLTELAKIKEHIPDQQQLITRLGSNAVPNRIGDIVSDIQQSSFVHFGCHGQQSFKDPLESLLLLSGGKLTMSRLIKDCRVPEGALAYLSACETAKGDEERPDESLNLVATMMFAGFRSVVGTLWSIMDEDAPVVAEVFYRHLFRRGREAPPDVRDAAYGLHLATKELRDRSKHLYNWVPYVHYGI